MRKSLQDIAHMVYNKPYPKELPKILKKYHYYIADSGHSIMCVLQMHLEEAQKTNMDDYEMPIPVKYVLEKGYKVIDGYIVTEAECNPDYGLIVDEKYLEY